MPELLFHGAAGEVTGSMHLVQHAGAWIALDCGLFQGRRSESESKNRSWPMPPRDIAAVVVSHAHTDHTGRLPKLVKEGFDGPIFCTSATRDLSALMLPDSAHIQEEDVQYLNKKRARQGLDPVEPLYGYEDAIAAVKAMQTVDLGRWFEVVPGVRAKFNEAGHMLGSAGILLEFDGHRGPASKPGSAPAASGGGATRSLYFTGDVGTPDKPIIRDPAPLPQADVIICESTYGNRLHEDTASSQQKLLDTVQRTWKRGGKVIMPAFSVGRTQTIVYFLHQAMVAGDLERRPVYVDSPLSVNATEVFKVHPECYDAEARAFHQLTGDILGSSCCTYIRSVDESKALHDRREPCVIISASGMCEAGRILHHLKNNIGEARNTVLFCGYQAIGTMGRRLAEGADEVRIFHEMYPVRAEVVQLDGFSGHADQRQLVQMLTPLAGQRRQVFLVHGEPEQSGPLAERLKAAGFAHVSAASRGERATF